MASRILRLRRLAQQNSLKNTPTGKVVLCYIGEKLVGEYDSITKCSLALGLSRPVVRKAIESGMLLDNGFTLTFKK
jgi:hypothetical protein